MPVKYGNSTTYNAVEQRLWLHIYILTGYEIVLINSLKRCLAHVERFIKDCSGLRPTVLDKRSLLRDGGKEV